MRFSALILSSATALSVIASARGALAAGPDFSREVRPILAGHCFKCHGPDDKVREAGLRLDDPKSSTFKLESGDIAIVPGKAADSELVTRINSTDADTQMPPSSANKPLSDHEKQVLRDWIAAGAEYKTHWAFLPPKQAPLPIVKQAQWPTNPIDYFVLARLEAENLHPSPPANRYALARRLYLDLIGLPPTPDEVDAFVNDTAPDAYEKLVDRLLASPHYGERWARRWLDLARYADTNGYEKDRPRIDLAVSRLGDRRPQRRHAVRPVHASSSSPATCCPRRTLDQRIATGFHRNTMLNEEGGIDPLEFRFYAMIDRVNTTGTVWLGLTVGCAQCHTHKFDPIPHREYYRFMAFLNNADEPAMDIPQPDIAQKRKQIEAKIAALEADLPNRFPPDSSLQWEPITGGTLTSAAGATAERMPDGSFRLSGTDPKKDTYTIQFVSDADQVAAIRVEALTDPALPSKGPGRTPHGNFVLSEISVAVEPKPNEGNAGAKETNGDKPLQPAKLVRAEADGEQPGFPATHAIDGNPATGWAIQLPGDWNVNRAATFYF